MNEADLQHFPIFKGLEQKSRQYLLARLFSYTLRPGQSLFVEGEPAEYCYFIRTGILRVLKMNPDGRVQVLSRLTPSMAVNVISLLNPSHRNIATVEALTAAELWALTSQDFDFLVNQHSDFSTTLLRSLAGRISQMTDMIAELSLYPVSVRLARFIIKLADSSQFSGNWTQDEIAAQIGTTRDIVGRLLREFDHRGLIRHDRSEIILLDRQGLSDAAGLPKE